MGVFADDMPDFAGAEAAERGFNRGPAGQQSGTRRGGRARRGKNRTAAPASAAQRVRAVIVGTDARARRGLRALIEVMPDVDIVAEAADGRRAAEQVLKHHPDLLLLSGPTPLIKELRGIPQIAELTELALLTWTKADEPGLRDSTSNGNGGGRRAGQALTPREQEVMALLAAGLSNRQIADELVVSQKTVKNHIYRIYQRIGVHERSQAVSHWEQSLDAPAPW
jgi:DNA-binding NarL/FixJ family response regulator